MVTISKTAVEKLNEVMKEEGISSDTHNLRVGVLGGGCSGLSYKMDFDENVEESDTLVELETFKVVINRHNKYTNTINNYIRHLHRNLFSTHRIHHTHNRTG